MSKKKLCLYKQITYDPKLIFKYQHTLCKQDFYHLNKKLISRKPWRIQFIDDVIDKIDIMRQYDIELDNLSIDLFCQCPETKQHIKEVRYIITSLPFHILWNLIYKTNYSRLRNVHLSCMLSIFNKLATKKQIGSIVVAHIFRYVSESLAISLLPDTEKTVELADCIYFSNEQYLFLSMHCKVIKHCLLEIDLSKKINFAILYTCLSKTQRVHILLELGNKIRKLDALISLLSEYDNASISENVYYYLYSHVFDSSFYMLLFSFRQLRIPHFITIFTYAVRSYSINYEFITCLTSVTEITIEQVATILLNGFCFEQLRHMFDLFPHIRTKKLFIANDSSNNYTDTLEQVIFLKQMGHANLLECFSKKYHSFNKNNKKKFATKLLKQEHLPIDVVNFLLAELYSQS